MRRKLFLLIVLFVLIATSLFFLFLTKQGAKIIVDYTLGQSALTSKAYEYDLSGSLLEGIFLENIELHHISGFPQGTTLRIQSLFFQVSSLNILRGITLTIDNARLFLPESETIFIFGSLEKGILDFNVYSRGFSLDELSDYFPDIKKLGFSGFIDQVDIFFKGNFWELRVQGRLTIQKMSHQHVSLAECPVEIDLKLENPFAEIKPFGSLKAQGGHMQAFRSVIRIEDGRIVFSGDFENPGFRFLGHSTIDGVKIRISLRGTRNNPQLDLSSSPSLSQEHLMIMLATGRRWRGLEDSLARGEIPENITKEFIDYFLFAQDSRALANYFGVSEFHITYEKDRKGLDVRKDLFDRWRIGYGLFYEGDEQQDSTVIQKILGEYEIIDGAFVGVERKMKDSRQESSSDESLKDPSKTDDRIFFRYKKDF